MKLFLLLFILLSKLSYASFDVTDALINKEEYKISNVEVNFYTGSSDEIFVAIPQEAVFQVGNKCFPKRNEKCWIYLSVENYSSITPYLRLINSSTQDFNIYYSVDRSDEILSGLSIEHYKEYKNIKNIELTNISETKKDVYIEYPEGKPIEFTASIVSKYQLDKKYLITTVTSFITLLIFLSILSAYVILRKKDSIKNTVLFILYFLLFLYTSNYHFLSVLDGDFNAIIIQTSSVYLMFKAFSYFLCYAILIECGNSYLNRNEKIIVINRSLLFIIFSFLVLLTTLGFTVNEMSYFNLIALAGVLVINLVINKKARLFYFMVMLIFISLAIVSYLGSYNETILGLGFDEWAIVLTFLSTAPAYLLFDDMKKSKVISVGLYKRLMSDSKVDFMTGVFNLKSLNNALTTLNKCHFYYIECVGLKKINAKVGHQNGDRMIMDLTEYFKSMITNDNKIKIYRVSGDEFVIASVTKLDPNRFDIQNYFRNDDFSLLRLSVGYSNANNLVVEDEALRKSEFACRMAGKEARSYVEWDDSDSIGLYCLPSYKEKAKKLFNTTNIVCFVQKIASMRKGTPNKIELLCRLQDADGAIHPAYRLLDISSVHGFEVLLDFVMIDHAETALKLVNEDDIISVNVCPQSVRTDEFIKKVTELSDKYPKRIMLEITEHSFYEDSSDFFEKITKLKSHNIIIALDDFGAGYSSYGILSSGYFDELKIDGALVKKINTDDFTCRLVTSISDLCHASGCKVTAEFVEDKALLTTLESMKVDYVQGYYIHKPEPILDYIKSTSQSS